MAGGEPPGPVRRDRGQTAPAGPGLTCWLCGQPVNDPPRIIGHYRVARATVAHKDCLRILGELDLELGDTL